MQSLYYSKVAYLLTCLCLCSLLGAQNPASTTPIGHLFKKHPSVATLDTAANHQHYLLQLNMHLLDSLCKAKPAQLTLQLPGSALPNRELSLELSRVQHQSTIRVKTSAGGDNLASPGLHYWGHVHGASGAYGVAISFFETEVMATLHDAQGNKWTLGRAGYNYPPDMYALYREDTSLNPATFNCGSVPNANYTPRQKNKLTELRSAFTPVNKTVYVYFECEYDLYVAAGNNVNNVVNYVAGIFNSVAMIYQMEGIKVEISEMLIWNTPDPYSNNPSSALFAFRDARQNFNGDLAHLITVKPGPSYAGIAFVSGFCNDYGYAYSQVASSYANYPNYSWSVNVVAHEMGHNFGSPHTHDCAWNGNNTPIDGCGPVVGSVGEGCDPLPPPTAPFKGTVMSYCHAVGGIGIDFNLGFGQQPGDLIRASVEFATCLPCDSPQVSELSVTGITNSGATLNCSTQGIDAFDWRYRIVGNPMWIDLANTPLALQALNGLAAATHYEFQVAVRCTDGNWSSWSASYDFTTLSNPVVDTDLGGVSDAQELINGTNPNNAADDFQVASLQIKVLLQGALFGVTTGLMRDELRLGAYLPLTDPYHNSGNPRFAPHGSGALTLTTPLILAAGAGTKDAIVDWIFIELRDSANAANIVETRAALVQRDGDVISATDGASVLRFYGPLLNKRYFISIKHRNHLGVMTANTHLLNSAQTLLLDFRTMSEADLYDKPGALNYNGAEMASIAVSSSGGDFAIGSNIKALWGGNSNGDNAIKYQGAANDIAPILQRVLNNPNNLLQVFNYGADFGYYGGDLNLNGNSKYQGALNDVAFLLLSISTFPLNLLNLYNYGAFVEQLP